MSLKKILAASLLLSMSLAAHANSIQIKMYKTATTGKGQYIGTVTATDTKYGLLLTPHLKNLSPGLHGFHVHVHPSCANAGLAAGGHLDPKQTGQHLGPYKNGHLGDLPALCVNAKGDANLPVLAPRLTVAALKQHALMIHVGGDNYRDQPKPLGGGGKRYACGAIQ